MINKMLNQSVGLFLLVLILTHRLIDGRVCKDRCDSNNTSLALTNCFCSQCDRFSDCCIDMLPDSYKNVDRDANNEWSCNVKTSDASYIYSISRCITTWSDNNVREMCEEVNSSDKLELGKQLIRQMPVYSNTSGLVYKNIYCAICNRVNPNEDGIGFFELNQAKNSIEDAGLEPMEIVEEKLRQRKELVFTPPTHLVSVRSCFKVVDTCAENSSSKDIEMCKNGPNAYRFAFTDSGVSINFKNEHCARCNSFRQDYLLCEPPPSGRSRFHSSSLQLLFDLGYLKAEISLSIRVRLNSTHTVNLNESGHSNTTLNVNQAALTALGTLKCSFYSQQLHNSTNVNLAKKYMTIVGLSISIVSIVILLAMYFAHKVLRNLPGLILISLGLSLMASQICFLLSSYFTKSFVYAHKHLDNVCLSNEFESNDDLKENIAKIIDCYTMATLTHYFYLTFFTWTNTMAYDLYSTLRRLDPNSRAPIKQDESSDRRRFVRFSLYSWLMPALVVSALTAKQFLIDSHAMSYGYRACFVSTNIDLLIFFVLPVALLLALNVYFLGACISMIRLVDKSTRKYLTSDGNSSSTGDDNKRRLVLFIKLFCLTGMTWILGLFSSFSENSFLWYIYILLNSLQGAFILFAFAFNTKTRNLVKKSSAYKAISTAIGSTRSRATMTSDSTI